MIRSEWDVASSLAAGKLVALLPDYRLPDADVVALVTHGDTIRAVQAVAAGLGPDGMPAITPHNGGITEVVL